tara:strand:- start:83 stop:985 length:903 start_codon:yes stop_codon:yes gene_type:complete
MNEIVSFKNIKKLSNSKNIIFTNDRIGISLLPVMIFLKLFYKINTVVIVMGMLSNSGNSGIIKFLRNLILKLFIQINDKFIFLGIGEFENARKNYKQNNKFVFFPFCVDSTFWKSNGEYKPSKRNKILFIGNDGNREFEKVIEIAKLMKNREFLFVSSNIEINSVKLENVEVISGNWNKSLLTDIEVRDIYERSLITILPLKNTLQPSGQSVTLQSMSCGVPVIISNTKGFWDSDNLKNNVHLIKLEDNSIDNWISKINKILENKELLNKISQNGVDLIGKKYDINKFNEYLEKTIIIDK